MTLSEYLVTLVAQLQQDAPESYRRIREIVGERRARVRLDDEVVDIAFGIEGFTVDPAGDATVDGEGSTTSATVLALIGGYLEVTDAIMEGFIRVTGSVDNVVRLFAAVELLIDASSRATSLQSLARQLIAEREDVALAARVVVPRRTVAYPSVISGGELALLDSLDLMNNPDPSHAILDEQVQMV